MRIKEVSSTEYQKHFESPYHCFNNVAFNLLNKEKVSELYFLLLLSNNKVKLGLIAGQTNDILKTPFSAPFGGFSYTKESINLEQIYEALQLTIRFAKQIDAHRFIYTPPPEFYSQNFINKTINALQNQKFNLQYLDLNYAISLKDIKSEADYYKMLKRNAKKNLKTALRENLQLKKCSNKDEIEQAYNIIKANRAHKGYPLRMELKDVMNTIELIPSDFFLLHKDDEKIAAAQIFYVTDKIVQVIYWGDKPGYESLRPINYLASQMVLYYKERNVDYIDIGPSSENGIPNFGLCDFKESIGAEVHPKYTFEKIISHTNKTLI